MKTYIFFKELESRENERQEEIETEKEREIEIGGEKGESEYNLYILSND